MIGIEKKHSSFFYSFDFLVCKNCLMGSTTTITLTLTKKH